VAGTAGGDGASGTPSGARLVPLRWDGPNGWTSAMVVSAYKYAADNGVKIVNASYNFDVWAPGGVPNSAVDAALTYAYGKGVLLMNSAGNNGALGAVRGLFTQPLFVANLNSADVRSSSSNYGSYVDVAAHGTSILSTTTSNNGTGVSYSTLSGTSMSTPHAAGVAALIWSKNPTQTRDQVAAQLLGTADSVDGIAGNVAGTLGTGRVNAFRRVTEAIAAPVFKNFVVTSAVGNPNQVASFAVTVPRRLDATSVV
jgi:subtilisin family serine protease